MIICPNLNNPEIAKGFEKLKSITGVNLAYKAYSGNNGNFMDKDTKGNTSKLYLELSDIVGSNKATYIKAFTFTNEFKEIYGEWQDKEVEPVFNGEYFDGNNKIYLSSISDPVGEKKNGYMQINTNYTPSTTYFSKVTNDLTSIFDSFNIPFTSNIDDSITSKTIYKDGAISSSFSSHWLLNQSIFHKYPYIYLDLANDDDYINYAASVLKDTGFYNSVKNMYSDSTDIDKDVLLSALHLTTEQIFGSNSTINWEFIKHRIISRVANNLSISDNQSLELLSKLSNSNVIQQTTYFSKAADLAEKNDRLYKVLYKQLEYLNVFKNELSSVKGTFKNDSNFIPYSQQTDNLFDTITDATLFTRSTAAGNLVFAIRESIKYTSDILPLLEKEVESLTTAFLNKGITIDNLDEYTFQSEFADILWRAENFIRVFNTIELLEEFNLESEALRNSNLQLSMLEKNKLLDSLENANKYLNLYVYNKGGILYKVNKLSKQLDALKDSVFAPYLISLSNNPKFANRTHEEFENEFMYDLIDEAKRNYIFDAVYDSPNSFIANAEKYKRRFYNFRDIEILKLKKEFQDKYDEFSKSDLEKIIDDGYIVSKWNKIKFYDDLEKLYSSDSNTNPDKSKKKSKYRIMIDSMASLNVPPGITDYAQYYSDEIENARNSMKPKQFNRWFQTNFFINKEGTTLPKIFGDYLIPKDTYLSSKYTAITSPKLMEFRNYLENLMKTLTEHVSDSPQYYGALPAISNKALSKIKDKYRLDDEVLTDINGDELYTIPFSFLGYLNNKEYIKYGQRLEKESLQEYENRILDEVNLRYKDRLDKPFTKFKQIEEENKKIAIENKKNHKENLNTDIGYTIPLFIESAMNHKYKSMIKSTMMLTLVQLKRARINQVTLSGKPLFDKYKTTGRNKRLRKKVEGLSNAELHFKKNLVMDFYEKFTKSSKANKPLSALKNYTSLLGIGFNPFSAVKNVTYGTNMTIIEAVSGKNFSKADLKNGIATYLAGATSYASDHFRDSVKRTSKQSAIIKQFNIIEDYIELLEKQSPELHTKKVIKLGYSAAYFMTTTGEHYMHNSALFAMLNSHRIINGKPLTLFKYIDGKLLAIPTGATRDEKLKIIKANKDIKEKAKLEFEKFPTVYDSIEFIDGISRFKLDENNNPVLSDREFSDLKERIKGINQQIHGIYNKSDKGTLENSIWFQLVMQFRHWMMPGWNKRFGQRGLPFVINSYWNERRGEYDIGDYNALFKAISVGMREYWDEHISDDSNMLKNTMYGVLGFSIGLLKYIGNIQMYWHTLNEYEKASAKRALAEIMFAVMLVLIASVIAANSDDDDEDNRMTHFMIYQLDASITELLTFVPIYGWFNETLKILANPTGTYNTFMTGYKFITEALGLVYKSDKEKLIGRGYYKGQYKAAKYGLKLVPLGNQLTRWLELPYNNSAYKLYGMPKVDLGGNKKKAKTKLL